MKFTTSVEINSPLEKVVKLFENPDNLGEWQEGFVSLTPISGKPGMTGAKSRIIFKNKKHTIELTETILSNNLPAEMKAIYEHKHMTNTMSNRFIALENDRTRYENEIHYTKLSLMPKIMSLIRPSIFTKPVQKWQNNFKEFVERDN